MRRLILLCLVLAGSGIRAQSTEPLIHIVAPGEQIGRLAVIYEVPADEILAANPLITPPLTPGQRLIVPRIRQASAAEPPPSMLADATLSPAIPTPTLPSSAAPPRAGPDRSSAAAFSEAIGIPATADIRYNGKWTPPGETRAWAMDCSNTARWVYRHVRGLEIPRTASGQYEWLKKQKRLWRVRDERSLRKKLKPGDLLFWEHTYRPSRKPPITHVMIYLGTDAQGRMRMAGSQGSRGVDFYRFDPTAKTGGYRFFLFFRKDGRFVAFGRP